MCVRIRGKSYFYFRRGTPSVIENAEGFFRQLPRGRSLLQVDPLRVAVMFAMRLHTCERAYANQPPFDREVASLRAGGSSLFKGKVTLPKESHKDSFVDPCAPRRLVLSVSRCSTSKTSSRGEPLAANPQSSRCSLRGTPAAQDDTLG